MAGNKLPQRFSAMQEVLELDTQRPVLVRFKKSLANIFLIEQ